LKGEPEEDSEIQLEFEPNSLIRRSLTESKGFKTIFKKSELG
jgi:hypothetical protein